MSKSSASLQAVPAHAIPTAIHAPTRTWGLNDSAKRATSLGTTSGVRNRRNPGNNSGLIGYVRGWVERVWLEGVVKGRVRGYGRGCGDRVC